MENKEILLGKETTYRDTYTTETLFPINRKERREGYTKMYGVDIWTAYEFSFLLPTGLPQYHVLRIHNICSSENIFESKGLKLYLNSFNNTIFFSLRAALDTIEKDLSLLSGKPVFVEEVLFFPTDTYASFDNLDLQFKGEINQYNYDSNLLKTIPGESHDYILSNLLRSNCEITGQPDWGRVVIEYSAESHLDRNSLLKYIVSYRNHREFHEPTCERIYQDLYRVLNPNYLFVMCQYTRRGGIDINPIRCSEDIGYFTGSVGKLLQQ